VVKKKLFQWANQLQANQLQFTKKT
jgi:hypothetical protein